MKHVYKNIAIGCILFCSIPWPVHADSVTVLSQETLTRVCEQSVSPRVQGQSAPGNAQWNNTYYISADDLAESDVDMHSTSELKDVAARLLLPGGNISAANAAHNNPLPTNAAFVRYDNDAWKNNINASDVNNPDFGFALQVGNGIVTSQFLRASDFGFHIPIDASIVSITVDVKERQQNIESSPKTIVGYVNNIRMRICYTKAVSANAANTSLLVSTNKKSISVHAAPGESVLLPISFMLYGNYSPSDFSVQYRVLAINGNAVEEARILSTVNPMTEYESIQIPVDYKPGEYTISANVLRGDQVFAEAMKFQIIVEPKVLGIFVSRIFLALKWIFFIFMTAACSYAFYIYKKNKDKYAKIPPAERVYYEIIDDMITQMHDSIGDRAYALADAVAGLVVDKKNGRIISITKDPSEVVAVLYIRYKNVFKRKIKVEQYVKDKKIGDAESVNENLTSLEKYFHKK